MDEYVPLRAIDHVQLAMPAGDGAEDAAIAFYQDLLGLTREPKPEPLARRGGCWFTTGGVRVHLGVEADFRPARKAHPAFVVEDLDRLIDILEAAGHAVRRSDEVEGMPQFYVDDPFGNRIELVRAG